MRKVLTLHQLNKFTYCSLKGYIDRLDHIVFTEYFSSLGAASFFSPLGAAFFVLGCSEKCNPICMG